MNEKYIRQHLFAKAVDFKCPYCAEDFKKIEDQIQNF